MDPAPSDSFSWRQVAVPVYGPTLLVSIGAGAILPLVALSARDLGASVGIAALVVAMLGIGQLVGDLPAGALAARIGERRALIIACLVDVVALVGAFLAPTVLALSAAVFVAGLSNAVFSLARQAYLTAVVPMRIRARAMSTLGGIFRIGSFIGPFVGAIIVLRIDIASAYVFAAVMSLAAAGLAALRWEPTDMDKIDACMTALERCVMAGTIGTEEDSRLHQAIADATHNSYHSSIQRQLRQHILAGMNITRSLSLRRTQGRVQLVQDEHVAIVEAIRRRDAEGASEQMRRHILNARRRMFEGTGA